MRSGITPRARLAALESHLLDRVKAAVLVTDLEGVVIFANPFCEVLYGSPPEAMIGQDALRYSFESLTPELISEIGDAVRNGESWEGEFRVEQVDGSGIDVHTIDAPVFDDGGKVAGVISIAFDITAQRLTQDEMRRMMAVTQILRDVGATLASELDIERLVQTVTDAARRLTGAAMGAFLRAEGEPSASTFVVAASSGKAREQSLGAAIGIDAPLLAAALGNVAPTRFDDVTRDPGHTATLEVVLRSPTPPLRSCVVMPVRSRGGEVLGAMVIAHPEPARFTDGEVEVVAGIAGQTGIALDIARLFRAAEAEIVARKRSEEVQRFYAETSAVLSSSLDYPESFERVGRLCVPFLADLCFIDVAEERVVRRLAAVHADPAKEALVAELEKRYPPDPYGAHPAASVVLGGESVVADTMSDEFLRATTRDERHLAIVKDLEFTSFMCVPIEARGRRLGALTLVSSGSGRVFGPRDLALAEEFGRRAGLALDNARLYSERDHVARGAAVEPPPTVIARDPRRARHRALPCRGRGQRGRWRLLPRVPGRQAHVVVRDRRRERQGTRGGRHRRSRPAHVACRRADRSARRAGCSRRCTRRCSAKVAASSAPCAARCCARSRPVRCSRSRAAGTRRPSSAAPTAPSRPRHAADRCSAFPSASRSSSR